MTTITCTNAPARPTPSLSRIFSTIATIGEVRRQRAALARMDNHLLEDIGLTAREAQKEANRILWNAPQHWKK